MTVDKGLQVYLERFVALGGIAENVCQREGEFGRGIFPIDPSRSAKIMTPRSLLINHANISIHDGEIIIKDKTCFTAEESVFIESYYNNHSWGSNGNVDSINYLNFISKACESVKNALVNFAFVDKNLLSLGVSPQSIFKRFVDERVFVFEGNSVLAPLMELINHSAYALPFRVTASGLHSPAFERGSTELLSKYSPKNSSMSIWKKYGFACRCIVAYSIPFEISINNESVSVRCFGQLGLGHRENKSFSLVADALSIKSLPVGCLSASLPFATFNSILCSAGLSVDVAKSLFPKVREINIKARSNLLSTLQEPGLGAQAELYKALEYEIELIESSLDG
ncbi:hypothetical protein PMIT1303_00334 [Prochlorococcus sp. MIT 1303]|nr:hypothetical protein PMIT1303_00334 [Prochlorococcus sp. MIT 1303]